MSTQYFQPSGVKDPRSVSEVVELIKDAQRLSVPIKAVGGCASMSDSVNTDVWLIHTFRMNKIERYNDRPNSRLFWLESGVTIYDIIEHLKYRGQLDRNNSDGPKCLYKSE
tara:strand:+ start:423 stop:755 length:333 start_codon:yes stop_codon:yes gene_type:complete